MNPTAIATESSLSPHKFPRVHPDLFTAEDAARYLHIDIDSPTDSTDPKWKRTLETLRKEHGLIGQRVGKGFMYHRKHLDACVSRLFGLDLRPTTR